MKTRYNEKSWAIDLISAIKVWVNERDVVIKGAGGERTLPAGRNNLFPDVLLFGDESSGHILQGWELKFPDTPIDDAELKNKAKEKAELLGLNSFLLWNVSCAVLYIINSDGSEEPIKIWNNLSHITKRGQVEGAKEQWHLMMDEILRDLAGFLGSGIIKSTSIIDSLTGEGITNFILQNTDSVAAELKNQCRVDSVFDDMSTLWWKAEHKSYPTEDAPWTAMARIILIVWLNKFIFAHVLKSFYRQAAQVEEIESDTTIKDAVKIFQSISLHCNFWNVFHVQLGEDKITPLAWENLIAFNRFLCEFNFSRVEQALLQRLLENTVYRGKRKAAGQFATPIEVAKLLVYLTIRNKESNVLDPCCGTGTIARSAYDTKKEYGLTHKEALQTTWASDKFAFPLHFATLAMVEPENMGETLPIFMMDATELNAGMILNLHNPYDGSAVKVKLPPIEYVVSNFPFVQQEDVAVLNPGIRRINHFITEHTEQTQGLDSRSDLYVYLTFYLWSVLAENGRMGIILPNAWLSTDYSRIFRLHLRNFFQIEYIITSGSGRWFKETDVVTNIILLKKKGRDELRKNDENRADEKISFVTINRSLSEFYANDSLKELAAIIRTETPDTTHISSISYNNQDISTLEALGLGWSALFADCKWLPQLANKLTPANTLFEIKRGERRGWDRMFYPSEGHDIEPEYIEKVLKNLKSVNTLQAETDTDAFCCTKSIDELKALGHSKALNWIRTFERQVNGKGVPLPIALSRPGIPWYGMLPNTMADLVGSINPDERIFIVKLKQRSFVNQRLIRFSKLNNNVNVPLCHALLNSLLGIFYIEALGFGRGLGVLDLNTRKVRKNLFMLNPSLLSKKKIKDILKSFNKLLYRDILPIEEELIQPDRIDFDKIVLNAYDISEYKELIVNAFMRLYKIRKSVE